MIRFSPTLFRYITRRYMAAFAATLAIACSITFLADWVETARKLSDDGASAGLTLQLAFYRLPTLIMQMLPYAALAAGAFSFRKLADTSELTAMRAAGCSATQFLFPGVCGALITGMFATALLQPIAATMHASYVHQVKILTQGDNYSADIVETGLWLKQQDKNASGTTFVRARRLGEEEGGLREVMFFTVDKSYLFLRRIDSPSAVLSADGWRINNPSVITSSGLIQETPLTMAMTSNISPRSIKESSAAPESVPFWGMHEFMRILKDSGFVIIEHLLEFLRLAAMPVSLAAMTFFGASFTLSHARFSKGGLSVAAAMGSGLVFFAAERLAFALGLSGKLPMLFAVLLTPLLATVTAMWMLLHKEEG